MITIFNRKELLITMDMKRQSEVRNILHANGIDYVVKTCDLLGTSSGGRGRGSTVGINLNYSYEYKIYVHKNDYDNAIRLI